MFDCGCTYLTKNGRSVLIVEAKDIGGPYHVVLGNDGVWRYARVCDAGRVAGSNFDMSHPYNLVVPQKLTLEDILGKESFKSSSRKKVYSYSKLDGEITKDSMGWGFEVNDGYGGITIYTLTTLEAIVSKMKEKSATEEKL